MNNTKIILESLEFVAHSSLKLAGYIKTLKSDGNLSLAREMWDFLKLYK
jgi:hypothetical protein